MQNRTTPSEIEYGWVREMRYQADFGCFEASVVLCVHEPGRDAKTVEVLTNVPARSGEAATSLRQRLVFDAARLFRLTEVGLAIHSKPPIAA